MIKEKEIHLRDYIKVVKRRRYTVYTFFLITFTVVLIVTLTSTPLYMATTKMLIEKSENSPLISGYAYMQYDPEFLETQTQIIKSKSVAQKVVRLLNLDKSYESFFQEAKGSSSLTKIAAEWLKDLFSVATKIAGLEGAKSSEENRQVVKEERSKADIISETISNGIVVEPVMNTRIVDVSFMSQNPVLSRMIVNSVAKAYIEEILEMKMRSSGYTIQWMTKKADEERGRLEKSENALQDYMRTNNILTIEDRVAIVPQRLSELSRQLTINEAKKKELEAVYMKVKNISNNLEEAMTIPVIAANPTLQSIRKSILKAEQYVMELSKKYKEKHPVMKRAVADLGILKEKREHEIGMLIKSIKNEFELAKSNEKDLSGMLSKTKDEATNLNEKFIQYGILKREVETNKNLYEALIKRIKEQGATEQTKTVDVWVVDQAKTPEFPASPKKAQNILLGIIVGLFGGIGLAFFAEYLDQTIKSPDEAEARFGVPVLGTVSHFKSKGEKVETIVIDQPASSFAESYKAIRTSVLLSSANSPPKQIQITSMSPEEGKTTTAINLAMAIAESESNVLLVDADLRRPRVHKVLELDNDKGLSTYLAGASDLKILKKGPLPHLWIMTAGPIAPNPSELLTSKRMDTLIAAMKDKFDFTIFDSPPIMTATESLILSKALEGTIIVTRVGKATNDILSKGLKSLNDVHSHVLGMVFNAVDSKKSHYDYYDYYHYDYYYSDDGDKKRKRRKSRSAT